VDLDADTGAITRSGDVWVTADTLVL
jgi:hypothetical protein